AVELDPASLPALRSLGFSFIYARRYDQARIHFERAITMNPNAEESYRLLGLAHALGGDFVEAERALHEVLESAKRSNLTYATLGYVLGLAGRNDEARTILAEMERERERDYVSPVALAMIELGLRKLDRALDWIEIAFAERRGWLAYLNVNPILDP